MEQSLWSIDELARKSLLFLNPEGDSSRVQWKPNSRQIRYYTTLGILDRPFGGRGHGSSYGPKHLLQLLAVKHLQHQGLTLAQVQEVLSGLSAEQLLDRLRLSQEWYSALAQRAPCKTESARRESDFWSNARPPTSPIVLSHQHSHFELGAGATLVIEQERIAHLSPQKQQQMAQDVARVWEQYSQEGNRAKEGGKRR